MGTRPARNEPKGMGWINTRALQGSAARAHDNQLRRRIGRVVAQTRYHSSPPFPMYTPCRKMFGESGAVVGRLSCSPANYLCLRWSWCLTLNCNPDPPRAPSAQFGVGETTGSQMNALSKRPAKGLFRAM